MFTVFALCFCFPFHILTYWSFYAYLYCYLQNGRISSMDFHKTSSYLVTASDDESIRLYDVASARSVPFFFVLSLKFPPFLSTMFVFFVVVHCILLGTFKSQKIFWLCISHTLVLSIIVVIGNCWFHKTHSIFFFFLVELRTSWKGLWANWLTCRLFEEKKEKNNWGLSKFCHAWYSVKM